MPDDPLARLEQEGFRRERLRGMTGSPDPDPLRHARRLLEKLRAGKFEPIGPSTEWASARTERIEDIEEEDDE